MELESPRPSIEKTDTEKPENFKSKKKKKSAERAGFLIVHEDQAEKDKDPSKKLPPLKLEKLWLSQKPDQNQDEPSAQTELNEISIGTEDEVTAEDNNDAVPESNHDSEANQEAVSEAQAPLETLGPDEQIAVERQLTAEQPIDTVDDQAEAAEQSLQQAVTAFIADFRSKIINENKPSEVAFNETLDNIKMIDADGETVVGEQLTDDEPAEDAQESQQESDKPSTAELPEPLTSVGPNDQHNELTGNPPPPPPPRRPTANEGTPADEPAPRGTPFQAVAGGYNARLHQALRGNIRSEYLASYNEQGLASAALIGGAGGIVGYLIGRRRGRIKTEKKLKPIQKKLEKEVSSLQEQLNFKETRIREVATAKLRERPQLVERLVQIPASFRETKSVAERPGASSAASKAESNSKPQNTAEIRRSAPEARQLHSVERATEQLGHILVSAVETERPRAVASPEKVIKAVASTEKSPAGNNTKQVETMSRAELMSLSDKIVVEGSSLRQIYESKLIGERGLRRLVSEHLQGKDVKRQLRQEIVEREIDFERDPVLRDRLQSAVSGGGESLKTLLDHVGATPVDEETAFYKARASYEAKQRSQDKKQRRIVDTSMVGAIFLLVILITVLLLTHH